MEHLQDMLIRYNTSYLKDKMPQWANQYLHIPFPPYWERVYHILSKEDKSKSILEIGCGLGDITSIGCYLKFEKIIAYERDSKLARLATKKIPNLFGKSDIIKNESFPSGITKADILIQVNCVYADNSKCMDEYKQMLLNNYIAAGTPSIYILEVIDKSYTAVNEDFPPHVRLSEEDIAMMFPETIITSYLTYEYPTNNKTKRLYIIKRI